MKKFQLCEKYTKTGIAKLLTEELTGVNIDFGFGKITLTQVENEQSAFNSAKECIWGFLDSLGIQYGCSYENGKTLVLTMKEGFYINSDGIIISYKYEYVIKEVEE